jgi:hypothetical protein
MTFLCPQVSEAASTPHTRHCAILINSCTYSNGTLMFISVNRSLLTPPQVSACAMLGQTAEVNFFMCRPIVHVVRSKIMHIDLLYEYIWVKNTLIYMQYTFTLNVTFLTVHKTLITPNELWKCSHGHSAVFRFQYPEIRISYRAIAVRYVVFTFYLQQFFHPVTTERDEHRKHTRSRNFSKTH